MISLRYKTLKNSKVYIVIHIQEIDDKQAFSFHPEYKLLFNIFTQWRIIYPKINNFIK